MKIHGFEEILAQHPVFKDCGQDTVDLLSGCARNEHFRAGETIFSEGDDAEKVFLLREGDVAIEISAPQHEPLIVETLHAGDVLGWSWLMPPFKHMSDARALNSVRAVSLDANCLRTKCGQNPELGYQMYQHFVPHLAARFRALRMQLLDVYGTRKG
ncbi:cyclic nucleotide-binding domain-containing protein [Roseibium sp.]|uniref:cyclic nucleotide-binding domain-containing protein n=1 Tax=Roseibium sp. TaxID=1936156 RepID=UPI003A97CCB8